MQIDGTAADQSKHTDASNQHGRHFASTDQQMQHKGESLARAAHSALGRPWSCLVTPVGDIGSLCIAAFTLLGFWCDVVVLVGDSFAGKTCLAFRQIYGAFDDRIQTTIKMPCYSASIHVDATEVSLAIWDTGMVTSCYLEPSSSCFSL
jgi:hypothetical protein